ncbi:MAG: 23S rRNA (uracil(1939)-C(5))-methyltransferase RlmD [Acidobacteriia bacterium]|nr:23S rRNA (uracil(1939)-C(5))-methyltransferase RlmD [Terriglobia bacterium]
MELTIEKLIYGGDGLAHLPAEERPPRGGKGGLRGDPERGKGKAVFVPFVLPGERVDATLKDEKPGFARARLNRVLQPAAERIEPGCPHFGQCGGCQYQHASYEHQLQIKAGIVRETLRRLAKLEFDNDINVHPSQPWNYRNRTRMRVRTEPEFVVGYNRFASHALLPVRQCPISSPLINRALATIWNLGEAGKVPAGVTEIEFFANAEDSELLLEVTLAPQHSPDLRAVADFARELRHEFPAAVGVVPFQPAANASVVRIDVPKDMAADFGGDFLVYRTRHANYRVSAGSFFQTNRFLIDEMVALVSADCSGGFALDLYAGVGLFSLPLSQNFRQVAAVESADCSFHDLQVNSPSNATGYRVDVQKFLAQVPAETRFDYVIVDPPRGGLGEKVALVLAGLKAPQITYVSCDPATLARDLRVLTQAGYSMRQIHLLDLFPQTFHIETVVRLER